MCSAWSSLHISCSLNWALLGGTCSHLGSWALLASLQSGSQPFALFCGKSPGPTYTSTNYSLLVTTRLLYLCAFPQRPLGSSVYMVTNIHRVTAVSNDHSLSVIVDMGGKSCLPPPSALKSVDSLYPWVLAFSSDTSWGLGSHFPPSCFPYLAIFQYWATDSQKDILCFLALQYLSHISSILVTALFSAIIIVNRFFMPFLLSSDISLVLINHRSVLFSPSSSS